MEIGKHLFISSAAALSLCVGARTQDSGAAPGRSIPFPTRAPLGLPELPVPDHSPLTAETFALGQLLFFDTALSVDRTVSCASCHDPALGFATADRLPKGVGGAVATRHAPTLLNRGYGKSQRWDGRNETLESFVLEPIEDLREMALPVNDAVQRLRDSADYRQSFAQAYGGEPNRASLAKALASFVRGLTYGDTPIDRFAAGDRAGLSVAERTGMWLFESKGKCWKCHTAGLFTDESFHNTGIGVVEGIAQDGRMAVTGDKADRGKFKTPTLRGLAHTAPFMHDGSLASLEDVVAFYRRGGNPNPNLDPALEPLDLTDKETASLVAFLRALSQR